MQRTVLRAGLVAATVLALSCGTLVESLGVKETSPISGATGVSPTVEVRVTFTRPLNAETVTHTSLKLTDLLDRTLGGEIAVEEDVATFRPSFPLNAGQTYRVHVLPEILNQDARPLAYAYTFEFTVSDVADARGPVLIDTVPDANAQNVEPSTELRAVFDEQLDATTVAVTTPVAETITVTSGAQAIATPVASLPLATAVRVQVPVGLKDLAGNSPAAPVEWTFFTRDGSWQSDQVIGATASSPTQVIDREERHVLIAVGGAGSSAGALWMDAAGEAQVSAQDRQGNWLAPEPVASDTVRRGTLVANARGDLIAAWQQDFEGRTGAAAFRRFDGETRTWEPGWHFAANDGSSEEPCAAVGANGHAWVMWSRTTGGTAQTYGRRYAPGSGWGAVVAVSSAPASITELGCTAAVAPSGAATLFFHGGTLQAATLLARQYTEEGGLGAELTLSPFAEAKLGNVAASPQTDGSTLVLWQAGASPTDLSTDTVWYRRVRADGTLDAPEIAVHNGLAAPARYGFDREGRAYVAWTATDGKLRLARRETTGWVTEVIPTPELDPASLSLAVDPRGNVLVTFDRVSVFQLWSVRWIRDLGWQEVRQLPTSARPYSTQHRLVGLDDGSAISFRVGTDSVTDSIVANPLK